MRIRPTSPQGGVVVELGAKEAELPGTAAAGGEPGKAFRLDRILVPLDFSSCSKKALRYALPFAREFGGTVGLLFVGQSYYLVPELAPLDPDQIEPRRDLAGRLRELALNELGEEAKVEVLVRNGHPATEIAEAAKEWKADLIIISTHGYTGLKHAWFGSTSESVVRHSPCPVLVVRPAEHEFVAEANPTAQ